MVAGSNAKASHHIPFSLYVDEVRLIGQLKCFYLVVDKEEHLYYYKNKKTNRCSRTNVLIATKGS